MHGAYTSSSFCLFLMMCKTYSSTVNVIGETLALKKYFTYKNKRFFLHKAGKVEKLSIFLALRKNFPRIPCLAPEFHQSHLKCHLEHIELLSVMCPMSPMLPFPKKSHCYENTPIMYLMYMMLNPYNNSSIILKTGKNGFIPVFLRIGWTVMKDLACARL